MPPFDSFAKKPEASTLVEGKREMVKSDSSE